MAPRSRALALALLLSGFVTSCQDEADAASASPTEPTASPELVAETDAWHAERLAKLQAPDSWLSLVALEWLEPGPNRVGRAPDAEVSYAGLPADHVGTIVVTERGIRFAPAKGIEFEGLPENNVLRTDADGDATVLTLGDIRFHLVVRGERLGVRMKDANAPTRTEFAGIERFPVDESWRIVADFVPAPEDERIGLDTVIGVRVESDVLGNARLERDGVPVDAVLFASGSGGSYLRFADATNGRDTYAAGRYLYVEPSTDGETVVLDFNRAYNPPCAFTEFATCSIPPKSNTFAFPVAAGERWGASE